MFFPTDAGDRLLANLHSGTPSLCAYVFSHPNLVEVAGLAGIDCFMADMMFTALDWADIAALIRAARGTGISPLIRVQAYPWSDGIDQRTVSDAARALALGATAVTISIASCAQMQALLRLRSDWHRLIHVRRFPTAADFPDFAHRVAQETLIVPTIESEGGLRDLEAIFALDGVQLVWLAAGDLSKLLGVPFQYEHPTMLALLERAVRLGERYGAGVMYNLGLDSPDFGAMAASARRFFDLGVRVVGLGAVEWHLQMALSALRQQTLGKRSA
jgi:2-keto-3-deoxy-L-rhamnonate aldolase RhmA